MHGGMGALGGQTPPPPLNRAACIKARPCLWGLHASCWVAETLERRLCVQCVCKAAICAWELWGVRIGALVQGLAVSWFQGMAVSWVQGSALVP